MGIKDKVAEIIMIHEQEHIPDALKTADKILQLMVLEGVEKYRECLECKGKGHQHCVAMSGIPYVAPCDHCETGEIVEPILFDEVEHSMDSYFQQRFTSDKWSRDDVDEVEFIRANLKPHLKEWRVRKEKP